MASFTELEFIYQAAKAHGMQWVTLTDHGRSQVLCFSEKPIVIVCGR